MNYRYIGDHNFQLKRIVAGNPAASLDEIRRSHPTLRSMSLDHLALRIGQLSRDPDPAATVRAGAKDIGAKAISYAEKNVQTSLDYAQSLLHAKDLTEVMRLHSEFVQAQMRNLAEQANEMGQIVSRAAIDAAKPKD